MLIHVYDTENARSVAFVLRAGKPPGGMEVRVHLRRLVRHIRKSWKKTRLTFRGDSLYCARGQAENLKKLHQSQLASDRTSCRSAIANQVRLVLHTPAYWLMLDVRDAIPKPRDLAKAEFNTLRLRLIKIAARVTETASRVRLAFSACCPDADLFRGLPGALRPQGP